MNPLLQALIFQKPKQSQNTYSYRNGWLRLNPGLMLQQRTDGFTVRSSPTERSQAEVGPVPTSPITTTIAAVSRAADVISASGALVSGLIGQTEGTIYAEVDYKSIATTKSIIAINDGTSNNRIQVRFASTTVFNLRIVIGGVDNDYNVTISPALSASGSFKVALAYKQNDYVLAVNGSLYASTASRNVPACTNLILGNSGFTSEFLNDRLRAAALYTTRLTDAQLAELTRLFSLIKMVHGLITAMIQRLRMLKQKRKSNGLRNQETTFSNCKESKSRC